MQKLFPRKKKLGPVHLEIKKMAATKKKIVGPEITKKFSCAGKLFATNLTRLLAIVD